MCIWEKLGILSETRDCPENVTSSQIAINLSSAHIMRDMARNTPFNYNGVDKITLKLYMVHLNFDCLAQMSVLYSFD